MVVHYVEVNQVGARGEHLAHFVAEAGESRLRVIDGAIQGSSQSGLPCRVSAL